MVNWEKLLSSLRVETTLTSLGGVEEDMGNSYTTSEAARYTSYNTTEASRYTSYTTTEAAR